MENLVVLRLCCAALCLIPASLVAQSLPQVAPGLQIPNGGGAVPYALDHFDGKAELVPVHHSTIEVNNHTGSNVAGAFVAGPFFKPKMTTELSGARARTVVHDAHTVIFVHTNGDSDPGGTSENSDSCVWAIVQAKVDKDRRIFAKVQFTQLTGHAKRLDGVMESDSESLPGGWVRLTPRSALAPGQYAVSPILKTPNTFSTVVYDFTLDPSAPNADDAVVAKPE